MLVYFIKHTSGLCDHVVLFIADVCLLPLQPGPVLLVALQLNVDGVYAWQHVWLLADFGELRLQVVDDAPGVGDSLLVVLLLRVLQIQSLFDVLDLEGVGQPQGLHNNHQQHCLI